MKIGYARVSSGEQNLNLQLDDLKREGCERIFQEKMSGAKHRPIYDEMLSHLRSGVDVLVVWDIDRMGRTLIEMIQTIDRIIEMKIGFRSISQPFIDTTTDSGEFVFKLFALLAEQERKRLIRRTKAGLAASRARGIIGGRRPGMTKENLKKSTTAATLYNAKNQSVDQIAQQMGISKKTLYKLLRHEGVEISSYSKS